MSDASGHEVEIDPITLELLRHSLAAIADEIEVDITRTAYSPLIYEYRDYAVGLLDTDGRLITCARGPIIFTADLDVPLADCLKILAEDGVTIGPEDVVLHNWGGVTGQHLNNVNAYTPAYFEGRIIGWSCVRMHWADVGGKDPGSSASNDTVSLLQEGFQLRAIRVLKNGEWDPEVLRFIEWNTRLPEQVIGDLKSQVFAALKGARLFERLVARYTPQVIDSAIHRIWDESEQLARNTIEKFTDGVYSAESYLDNDGRGNGPVHIPITLEVAGSSLTIDFTQIADQLEGPFNSGNGAVTIARAAMMFLLGYDRRADEGQFRPLRVEQRRRSFLTAEWPAPLARWSMSLPTVVDTILRAASQMDPGRMAAGHHGVTNAYYFFGADRNGRFYKHMDAALGGWGALPFMDGPGPYKTLTHGDSKDIPIEVVERTYPISVVSYGFRPDSGGVGKHRGGMGTKKVIEVTGETTFSCVFDREYCPPWGLFGGGPGQTAGVEVTRPGEEGLRIRKISSMKLAPGSRVVIEAAGGGGWGDPAERDTDALARDIRLGFVTEQGWEQAAGTVAE